MENTVYKDPGCAIDIVLLLMGVGSVVVSIFFSFNLECGEWFQRSGALLVLFSAILEFRHSQLTQPLPSDDGSIGGDPIAIRPTLPKFRIVLHRTALLGVVMGTIIWGYGDLLFANQC